MALLFLDLAHQSAPVCVSGFFLLNRRKQNVRIAYNLRYPSSSRFLPNTTCWILTIFDWIEVPCSGPQMQKRFHIHKEHGPFCLIFIYITSILCFLLVASINTLLSPVSTSAKKNGVCIGENSENNQTIANSHRSNMTDTLFSHKEY